MLESIPVTIIIGTALGALAGLGVGGGSILILWLTLILHMPAETARCINLIFFLPTAIIGTVLRWRKGSIHFNNILPAIISGVVSAIIFVMLGRMIPNDSLRIPFGILLLITGIREICYRPRKAR